MHYLARELGSRGHSVTLLALRPEPRISSPLRWSPEGAGYQLITSETPERELSELIASQRVDRVIVGGYHSRTVEWARRMLAITSGLPTVLYLQDVGAVELAGEPDLKIDRVVAVSRFLAQQAGGAGAGVACIEPIVEHRRYGVATTRRVALFVNPVPQKGVEVALELARARPDVQFAFVRCWHLFDGPLRALRDRAAGSGNVEIRDGVLDPRLLYGDARVLLVPSRYPEAWPRVAAEAQASGIPVIGTQVGGVAEAAGYTGAFVDPEAPMEQWVEALTHMWEDENGYHEHVAEAARAGRRSEISPQSVGDRLESLLRSLR